MSICEVLATLTGCPSDADAVIIPTGTDDSQVAHGAVRLCVLEVGVAAIVAAGGVGATDSARLIAVTARFATTERPHADRIVHVLDSSSAQRAVALATKAAFLVDRKVEVRYQAEFGNARAISMTPLRAGAIGGVLALHALCIVVAVKMARRRRRATFSNQATANASSGDPCDKRKNSGGLCLAAKEHKMSARKKPKGMMRLHDETDGIEDLAAAEMQVIVEERQCRHGMRVEDQSGAQEERATEKKATERAVEGESEQESGDQQMAVFEQEEEGLPPSGHDAGSRRVRRAARARSGQCPKAVPRTRLPTLGGESDEDEGAETAGRGVALRGARGSTRGSRVRPVESASMGEVLHCGAGQAMSPPWLCGAFMQDFD